MMAALSGRFQMQLLTRLAERHCSIISTRDPISSNILVTSLAVLCYEAFSKIARVKVIHLATHRSFATGFLAFAGMSAWNMQVV